MWRKVMGRKSDAIYSRYRVVVDDDKATAMERTEAFLKEQATPAISLQ